MHRKIERIDSYSIKLVTFVTKKIMEKKWKTKFVEDSFDSSDCSVFEINIKKWCDAERERLASMGKDITKFCALADPEINDGSVCCEDYAFAFNRDEGVIDLIVNGEEGSFIWDNVIHCVLSQFASCLGKPENFLYRVSTSTSDKKEFYGFLDEGQLIQITEFTPSGAWKAENFDSLIGSMYNINIF